jgi:hypothetical protein
MTNTPNTNWQHQASSEALQRKDWKKPVLDVLALADAEAGRGFVNDRLNAHKSG